MKLIDTPLLDATTAQARQSPRLRMNYNFHEELSDPVNRLINAVEPGTYIRPHRHCDPDKDELFLVLRGKIGVFIFDDNGRITEKKTLSPAAGVYGADIPAGAWHGIVVLENATVIYEVKAGPFTPLAPENLAPWSPAADDRENAARYLEYLLQELER